MGLFDWLRNLLQPPRQRDTVPFFDVESGLVVQIPRSELSSNVIQVQLEGMDELVWVLPDELRPSAIRHGPFDEPTRDYIRAIQTAFAEHRDLTLEEWEDRFRRDATPEREIALWLYASEIYSVFATEEPSPEKRRDIYRCIVGCMVTGPDSVWEILQLNVLDSHEAKRIVDRFYGNKTGQSNSDDSESG